MKRMVEKTRAAGRLAARKAGRHARFGLVALAVGMTTSGRAALAAKSPSTAGGTKPHSSGKRTSAQVGRASWYGGHFNGRKTATGERFDMNALTCAHPSLPLGSWVRVTNLVNKKIAFLRVNDRGPFSGSRIVDLSYAAAQKLGIAGLGHVRVEQVAKNDAEMAEAIAAEAMAPEIGEIGSRAADLPALPASAADR